MSIDQEITQLPPAPQRADAPADFSDKADAHVASLSTLVTQLNTYAEEANTTQGEINQTQQDAQGNATSAAASAGVASTAALQASASANFKGAWNVLVGALNVPASVLHDGVYWMLLVNLPDVTASEPGPTNPDWSAIVNPTATVPLTGGGTLSAICQVKSGTAVHIPSLWRTAFRPTIASRFLKRTCTVQLLHCCSVLAQM